MQCPKCEAVMELVEYQGIHVDRCTECKGLWFDLLEQEQLQTIEGAESIDTGDEFVGAQFDQIRAIECPRCQIKMSEVSGSDNLEITWESCPTCYGVFFDAGEFTDYLEEVIVDKFLEYKEKRQL